MKRIELVVLMNGNFVVIEIDEDNKDRLIRLLIDCCKEALTDPAHYLSWGDFTILSKAIVGWYFRIPVQSATQKLVGLVEKSLGDGDDWKTDIDND